ncbi:unnamed protein product, partial [Sphacelaria rigidula]
ECRKKLKDAVDKRAAFAEIEKNFHPAFRFFFLEKFPEPFSWYNRRLTFTRHVCFARPQNYTSGFFR